MLLRIMYSRSPIFRRTPNLSVPSDTKYFDVEYQEYQPNKSNAQGGRRDFWKKRGAKAPLSYHPYLIRGSRTPYNRSAMKLASTAVIAMIRNIA